MAGVSPMLCYVLICRGQDRLKVDFGSISSGLNAPKAIMLLMSWVTACSPILARV